MQPTVTRSLLLSVLFLFAATPGRAVSVDAVPTPPPNQWVVDMVGLLQPEDREALNVLGREVETQTGAQLAVVVVASTDGAPHRQFATDLANRWGLGDRERDNGVLVFAALDDRAAEITLGEGIDGAGQVTIAQEIMHGEMVPRFRQGEAADAIFYGALACARRILGATPSSTVMPSAPVQPPTEQPPATSFQPRAAASPVAFPTYAPLPVGAFEPAPQRGPSSFAFFLPLFGVGLGIATLIGARYYYRRRPRRCEECLVDMVRLDEAEDDAHLSSGERAEERVGSVDYDVWLCLKCNAVQQLRYGAFFHGYATCPKCGAKTVSSRQWTEEAATEWSEGRVRIDEACQHCDHRNSYTRSIPREELRTSSRSWSDDSSSSSSSSFHSSSSSSGSSSSSFSSSSSSPSSSSSSSGGGGGSSAGSGASGRW